MGGLCSSCQFGSPCSDSPCKVQTGSPHLKKLLEEVRKQLEAVREGMRADEQAEVWILQEEAKFLTEHELTYEKFGQVRDSIKTYLCTPRPTIAELIPTEQTLLNCLSTQRTCTFLDCQHAAQALFDLASIGRDPSPHCRMARDPVECMYRELEQEKQKKVKLKQPAPTEEEKKEPKCGGSDF